jgi:hypothetical protein
VELHGTARNEAERRIEVAPDVLVGESDVVDDALFAAYKNQFAYDPLLLDAVVEVLDESSPYWKKEKVSFNAA